VPPDPFADLLAANERYAARFALAGLSGRAEQGLAVVTCMDARIEPLALLGLRPGDANVIRNAGARIGDDELAALALAARELGVSRVMVVAHTDCRAVRSGREEILRGDVERIRSSPAHAGIDAAGFVYDVGTGRLSRIC
jgi:carbonic anhydrase